MAADTELLPNTDISDGVVVFPFVCLFFLFVFTDDPCCGMSMPVVFASILKASGDRRLGTEP
jgi:hypothetical protein